ncbi:MAG: J domain-containing protein [Candidatus Dependentiae bacterium]|nr:J domain-containing protein [Candidatus Dependentiae bacterium]
MKLLQFLTICLLVLGYGFIQASNYYSPSYYNPYAGYEKYYDLLGIPHRSTKNQINAAYKNLARIYHPDKWNETTNEAYLQGFSQQEAQDKFIRIENAKNELLALEEKLQAERKLRELEFEEQVQMSPSRSATYSPLSPHTYSPTSVTNPFEQYEENLSQDVTLSDEDYFDYLKNMAR